jgi:hypothetical protein
MDTKNAKDTKEEHNAVWFARKPEDLVSFVVSLVFFVFLVPEAVGSGLSVP